MSTVTTRNAVSVPLVELASLPIEAHHTIVAARVNGGARVSAMLRLHDGRLLTVLADASTGVLELVAATVPADGQLPSLTPAVPAVHLFERELHERYGLGIVGHPGLVPVRRVLEMNAFQRVTGPDVHEVAVGPVHAGVIEPGHFRFQCHGEEVFLLDIALGYQHRGITAALEGGPHKRSIHQIEAAAGDTTIGHTMAWCEALEALAGVEAPSDAHALRAIALELERLANHTGDLGALANDVGFLPTASFCGRLRGDFLNATALLCGSRFGRGLVRPGGVAFGVDGPRRRDLLERVDRALAETAAAVGLLWATPSVLVRFEDTGVVTPATAREIGLVGPAARASGLLLDVRVDHPTGAYGPMDRFPWRTRDRSLHTEAGWGDDGATGDVYARALVRSREIEDSAQLIGELVAQVRGGPLTTPMRPLAPSRVVVSLVEGWRGEIAHVLATDAGGKLATVALVDPSFHNWSGLAMALRGQAISDFPLCNKSFNLSYCGFDL